MEEIDIIELLKRVKEGKAPKEIEVDGENFILKDLEKPPIDCLYYKEEDEGYIINWLEDVVYIDTKIKILDKPIIEECDEIDLQCFKDDEYVKAVIRTNRKKINEIIKYINKGE